MQKINSQQLVQILHSASQVIDTEVENVSTDSRTARKGDVFIALRGEKFDGHNFVKDVLARGVELAVVEKMLPDVPAVRQIVVPDTLEAFGRIGAYNRSLFKGTVIGLTGSAGKTTTKEEIKFLLSKFGSVYATEGNHNNFIGVPRSLCDLNLAADYAVIEMGMSAKGEISRLTSYVKPDIAIVTNVYPMHIEFFPDFESIAEAKAEIFEGLQTGGTAIVNEDANFAELLEKRALEHDARIVTYGCKNIRTEQADGTVTALIGGEEVVFQPAERGEHIVANALCALTTVSVLGLDASQAAAEIKNFGALPGRGKMHCLKLPNGGTYTLIDDSYSGQPEAMKLALKSLDLMPCRGRKIAVLGKMAELGKTSKAQHIEVGKVLAETGINIVVGVKEETKDILAQLPADKKTYFFENKDGLDEFLRNKLLQNNDIVLIKGARYSSELYKTTEALLQQGSD